MVLSKITNQIGVNFRTVLKPVTAITAELLIILEIIEEIVLRPARLSQYGKAGNHRGVPSVIHLQ